MPPHCLHPPPGARDQDGVPCPADYDEEEDGDDDGGDDGDDGEDARDQDGVPCPADYAELTHVRPS